jgi:hypothetical protein
VAATTVNTDGTVVCTAPAAQTEEVSVTVSVYHTATGAGTASLCESQIGAAESLLLYKKLCISAMSGSGLTHTAGDLYVILVDHDTRQTIMGPTNTVDTGVSSRTWTTDPALFCKTDVTSNIRLELWDSDFGEADPVDDLEATGFVISPLSTGTRTITLDIPGDYPDGTISLTVSHQNL